MQPALAGSAVVAGDTDRLIKVLLLGPAAVLPADRERFANIMPPFGAAYSDAEIASMINYLRKNFRSRRHRSQPGSSGRGPYGCTHDEFSHPLPLFSGRYRWVVCALLFAATTINYIDRQILSLIKPILDDQLHWTNAQFGQVNSAFQAAYAVGVLFFGWFIDRFGTRLGYGVSIAAWSVAAVGHALVGSIPGFFLARIALGLGEGGNFPSAIKAVALWFPKRERAFATGLFNAGANIGAIIAPAIVPWIALTWGWHMTFVLAGAAGFLWLFFWTPLYNVPGTESSSLSPGRTGSHPQRSGTGRQRSRPPGGRC